MPLPTCQTCPYHTPLDRVHSSSAGDTIIHWSECRRNAPVIAAVGNEDISGWPRVEPADGCGEHPRDVQARVLREVTFTRIAHEATR